MDYSKAFNTPRVLHWRGREVKFQCLPQVMKGHIESWLKDRDLQHTVAGAKHLPAELASAELAAHRNRRDSGFFNFGGPHYLNVVQNTVEGQIQILKALTHLTPMSEDEIEQMVLEKTLEIKEIMHDIVRDLPEQVKNAPGEK